MWASDLRAVCFHRTADAQVCPDAAHLTDVRFEYPDAYYTDGGDEDASTKNIVDCLSKQNATLRIESSNRGPCRATSLILELGDWER